MATPSAPEFTLASYALLAELAGQQWSVHALAAELGDGIRREASRLLESGLVTAVGGIAGEPSSYAISDAGRAELDAWLALPTPGGFSREYEALLTAFFASTGDLGTLGSATARMAEGGAAMRCIGAHLARLEGGDRMLDADFLKGLAAHLEGWAERASTEIGTWTGVVGVARRERALRIVGALVDQMDRGDPEDLGGPAQG